MTTEPGAIFSFLLVASRLYEPMSGNLINLGMLNLLTVPVERMNEIADYPAQTGETSFSIRTGMNSALSMSGFPMTREKTVLKDVSFTAKQGEVTALVGPSGGGKTTWHSCRPPARNGAFEPISADPFKTPPSGQKPHQAFFNCFFRSYIRLSARLKTSKRCSSSS